jgi:DNA primase
VPLAWEELDPKNDLRRAFTPRLVLQRVTAGVDPWRDMDDAAAGARVLKAAEPQLSF